ncbi:hypothetical protein LCGC14_2924980, partial [marine sediment metagenome]
MSGDRPKYVFICDGSHTFMQDETNRLHAEVRPAGRHPLPGPKAAAVVLDRDDELAVIDREADRRPIGARVLA